jgi:hydroxypyruvate isomerase
MTDFSANLGFLWQDLKLPDAIRAAARAGFSAVEFHWPYETDAHEVSAALNDTGLPLLGINTHRGDPDQGENGLSALPDRKDDAAHAIAQAIHYAQATKAEAIHVMAGRASGCEAHDTFVENLKLACRAASSTSITILIEPLNAHDAPGYFLRDTHQAEEIIAEVGTPNLKLMFDCYHIGRTEGDVIKRLRALTPIIGHIQFASVPDRGPPDQGKVDYAAVFSEIERLAWSRPLGAEYRPQGRTEDSLSWMARYS